MNQIIIYTDGASRGNPGPGGYGAIIATPDMVREIGGSERETTNNRMELKAPYEALKLLSDYIAKPVTDLDRVIFDKDTEIIIYSDSTYVVKGITSWIHAWYKRDWKTMTGAPVEHRDLWEGLYELSNRLKPKWVVLKGHSGIEGNERCDVIATAFADDDEPKLYNGNRRGYTVSLVGQSVANPSGSSSSKSKSSSSKPAYSYVSLVGGRIVVSKTWAECEKLVKGKSGARFKKVFSSVEEGELIREWTNK